MSDTLQQAEQQDEVVTTNTSEVYEAAVTQQKDEFGGTDYSMEEYAALARMYEGTLNDISENEIITGRIVQINDGDVSIDIGFKSEGIVSSGEFSNIDDLKAGDEVEVYLERVEDKEGKLVLSRRRADFMRVWEKILKAYENQEVLVCKVLRRIKGGFVVDLTGIESFLPGSQVDVRPVRDFDALIDKDLDVRVVKINHANENVVVSHKVLLEESLAEQREEILSKLEKGLVLEGAVKAITDFGVFVDLGGVDGLVHITDLAWGRVNHPSEVVELDQKIQVVVLEYDEERKRISLGMKQLTPHPWDSIDEKIAVGQVVTGKVVSLTDYGAFVEIEHGVEGLIHISEMSWTQHIKHPSQVVALGQMIECKVLNLDKEEKKISLGLKQLEPDPWDSLLEKYPIGTVTKGVVRNLANFGAFVELEPGIDGLVHISDMSWTKKLRHPGEMLNKADEIEVMVLDIDAEQRRISLGHKQVTDNPWEQFGEEYGVGSYTAGKVVRIIDKGVIVELPRGVDGFVPTSQLTFAPVKEIAEYFKVGDELPLNVIEFDQDSKKIVLSAVEALKNMDDASQEEYFHAHPVPQSEPTAMQESAAAAAAAAEAPAEAAPAATETPAETPAEAAPVATEAPAEDSAPVEEAPAEEAPAADNAPEEAAETAPVEETPAAEATETTEAEAPVAETEATPAEEAPSEEVSSDATAQDETPAAAEETPAAAEETPAAEASDETAASDEADSQETEETKTSE